MRGLMIGCTWRGLERRQFRCKSCYVCELLLAKLQLGILLGLLGFSVARITLNHFRNLRSSMTLEMCCDVFVYFKAYQSEEVCRYF